MGNLVILGPLVKSVPPPVKIRVIMLRNMDNLAILGPLEKDGYGILGNLAIPGPHVKPIPHLFQTKNLHWLRIRGIMPRYMDKLAFTGPLQQNCYGIMGNSTMELWVILPGPLVKPLLRPVQKENLHRRRIRGIMPQYMDKLAITGPLQQNRYGIMSNSSMELRIIWLYKIHLVNPSRVQSKKKIFTGYGFGELCHDIWINWL